MYSNCIVSQTLLWDTTKVGQFTTLMMFSIIQFFCNYSTFACTHNFKLQKLQFFFGLYNNFLMYIYSNKVCSLICINNWPIVYVVLCILRLQSMYSNVFHLFLQAQLPEMHGDPRKTSQCTTIQRK